MNRVKNINNDNHNGVVNGGRILLLKSFKNEDDDQYALKLKESNYIVDCIPVIDFEYINNDKLIEALKNPESYGDLIITSPRSIRAILNLLDQNMLTKDTDLESWKKKRTYVVGQATNNAAKSLGLETVGGDSGNADELSDILIEDHQRNKDQERPLLFLGAEVGLDILPNKLTDSGVKFINIPVYKTCKHALLDRSLCDYIAKEHIPDYIVFFSPSIVRFTQNTIHNSYLIKISKMIALGVSTSKCMSACGINVFRILNKPDVETLIHTLKSARNDTTTTATTTYTDTNTTMNTDTTANSNATTTTSTKTSTNANSNFTTTATDRINTVVNGVSPITTTTNNTTPLPL